MGDNGDYVLYIYESGRSVWDSSLGFTYIVLKIRDLNDITISALDKS